MRVVRTEMYFAEDQVVGLHGKRKLHAKNPGLGFAWLRTETAPFGIEESLLQKYWIDRHESTAQYFLDLAIRGREQDVRDELPFAGPSYSKRTPLNRPIVHFVMNGGIVVENSPPELVTFKSLLAKAPGVVIGTFVGMKAAGDATALMLLTVPTGIIVCSSAIGVSKALEKGLNKAVEKLIKQTLL